MGCVAGRSQEVIIGVSGAKAKKKYQADDTDPEDVNDDQPRRYRIASMQGFTNSRRSVTRRMGTKTGYEIVQRIRSYNLENEYELLVIGAGPVGMQAAKDAAGRGVRVGLIDCKSSITGIPTGAHSKCVREAAHAGAQNWDTVQKIIETAARQAAASCQRLVRTLKVEVICGSACIVNSQTVKVYKEGEEEPKVYRCMNLMIATGSKANRFPPVDYTLPGVFDSDSIQSIDRIPGSLLVQGSGIIGLEYAVIFKKLGVKTVTVVDICEMIVPMLDNSLRKACLDTLKEEGIELVLQEKFASVILCPKTDPPLKVTLQGGRIIRCDCLLSACGRSAVVENLGLDNLTASGLKLGRGNFIQVDQNGFTGVPGVWAAGDVTGSGLATIGQAMAMRSIRSKWGSGMVMQEKRSTSFPSGVWTMPEMAWCGLSDEEAIRQGIDSSSVTIDFSRSVRGCVSQERGFLKLVFRYADGVIIGVHMIGENSCDIINFGAEAVSQGRTVYDILNFVFPAVTYHELYHLAAAEGKLLIMHKGCDCLEAAFSWQRVEHALRSSCRREGETVQSVLQCAFKYFDLDSSGFITPMQLKGALRGLGMDFDDRLIYDMVFEATGSRDNENIDYEHFLRIFLPDADATDALKGANAGRPALLRKMTSESDYPAEPET